MIVINNKSQLDEEKIQEVLNLLPDEYHALDIEIRIFGTIRSYMKTVLNIRNRTSALWILAVLIFRIDGGCYRKYKFIDIYYFITINSHEFLEEVELSSMFVILHEIQHKYQEVFMKDKFIEGRKKYKYPWQINWKSKYVNNVLEKDANEFAFQFLHEHKSKIDKILDIDCEYTVDYSDEYISLLNNSSKDE